jgi:hypothetical protein
VAPPVHTPAPESECEQCGGSFAPRQSGGKPQRFCSSECRSGFHNAERAPPPQRIKEPETLVETLAPNIGLSESPILGRPKAQDDLEFDWISDGTIVLREQRATAIYRNGADELVIRQRADWNEEADTFIVITAGNEQAFLDRLCDVLGICSAP